MRIAVFGATGMAGGAIVDEALSRGHSITAASRAPDPTARHERLVARAADVANPSDVASVLTDVDAAVLAVRLAPGQEHRLAEMTRGVLDTAARAGTRILIVGGSAPLISPTFPDRQLIEDDRYVPQAWQPIARASLDQFRTCHAHRAAQWVYLSPPAILEPGTRTGRYRRGGTTLLTDGNGDSRITVSDLAIAAVDELEHPSKEQHFTVASTTQ